MSVQVRAIAVLIALIGGHAASAADHQVQKTGEAPTGLAKPILSLIDKNGYRVKGPDGLVCEVWFLKNIPLKSGFKANFTVKYPFNPGQLVGVIRIPKKKTFIDFRGQEMPSGVYTLRYGQQPEDGNHIGTSDTADFLLALPAKKDRDPKKFPDLEKLNQTSGTSVDSAHPAILSLLPDAKVSKTAKMEHDENKELWILNCTAQGKDKDKVVRVAFRLVTTGQAEE